MKKIIIIFFLFFVFKGVSYGAWTYTTGVLRSSGATESSPDSLLAGISIVQTADATRGYRNNLYGRLNNVRIDIDNNSWVKFDDDGQFEFTGNTRTNPFNETSNLANNGGSIIFGYRMVLIINTNTSYVDASCRPSGNGGNFISLRSPSGINPIVIQQTGTRNDFPTFDGGLSPNKVDIGGLTIRNNGSSRKVYFGFARNLVKAENMNFETTTGEYQTAQTTYQSASFPWAQHSGDSFSNTSNFYNTKWGTEQTGTISFSLGTVRHGNYINYNPIFPTSTWNGNYIGSNFDIDNRYAASLYLHSSTFKNGANLLSGVNTRWKGVRTTGTYDYNLTNISESLTKTTTTNSTGKVSNYLLSAIIGREGGSLRSSNKYKWTFKSRKYDFKYANENIWIDKSFLSDGENGPLTEEVQMLQVPYLTITELEAQSLTGISFVANGSNGGTVTINQSRSINDIWHYYRYWISQLANFDSNDTWTFDGNTLNIGDWNIVVTSLNGVINSPNLKIKTTGTISVSNGGIINALYEDSTANSGVKIYTPYNNQIVRVYGSISDMNGNTNTLGTYTSDINGELIYRYNSNISTKRYFKTEMSSSIGKGSMKSYVLNPGLDNELDMRTGGDFTYINLQLRQIKGSGFDSNLHSLRAQYSTGGLVLSTVDKSSIAEYVRLKMEEPSSLLSRIYNLLQEIFTRIISIKYDTQKIN